RLPALGQHTAGDLDVHPVELARGDALAGGHPEALGLDRRRHRPATARFVPLKQRRNLLHVGPSSGSPSRASCEGRCSQPSYRPTPERTKPADSAVGLRWPLASTDNFRSGGSSMVFLALGLVRSARSAMRSGCKRIVSCAWRSASIGLLPSCHRPW